MKTVKLPMPKQPCALRLIAKTSLVFFLFLTGCSGDDERPADVLDKDKMALILTDVHLIEGAKTGRKIMGDTLNIETYYAKVFNKHNSNQELFNKSFDYYTKHPKEMNDIYEVVVENLNRIQVRVPTWEQQEKEQQTAVDSLMLDSLLQAQRNLIEQSGPFTNKKKKQP